MTALVDRFLDHTTTYRLVLYYLVALVGTALALSFLKLLPHDPSAMAFTCVLATSVCWICNRSFTHVFGIPANTESTFITALILVLILDPARALDLRSVAAVAFAAIWATASKFIFAIAGKHVFNPAAFGVLLAGLLLDEPATWWVGGNIPLFPVVLAGGILIVYKLGRIDLVITFILVNVTTVVATAAPSSYGIALREAFLSSPLFFFAFVMLTEPLTAPTKRLPRLVFAGLVGFLSAPNIHAGSFYFTPEAALLVGNLFAYLTGPKRRFALTLKRIEQTATNTYDFIFTPARRLAFEAGQYLEWTLGLDHADSRGNRRYFTIASAPTEQSIRLGVKFYPAASAFKRRLAAMSPGDTIFASQLAGDFTLPSDPRRKLAFLAGGIGITPFRSMLQSLLDRGEGHPIVVIYGNERQQDIAYRDVLERAERELGIRTIHAVAEDPGRGQYPGYIDGRLVRQAIPDFHERLFYVSGPQAMVKALRATLLAMGVRRSRIKVDFFPGLA